MSGLGTCAYLAFGCSNTAFWHPEGTDEVITDETNLKVHEILPSDTSYDYLADILWAIPNGLNMLNMKKANNL